MAKDLEVRRNATPSRIGFGTDFERVLDRLFGDRFSSFLGEFPVAHRFADVEEAKDSYRLSLEVPGVPIEDIDISVSDRLLTVKAEHQESKGSEEDYEENYERFYQTFTLPDHVDPEGIKATCKNGMLKIEVPKTPAAQPRKIEIQSGKDKN